MPYNNFTYDEDRTRMFFRQKMLPGIIDSVFQSNPFLSLIFGSTSKGGRDYEASASQLKKGMNRLTAGVQGSVGGRLWIEQPVQVEQLTGTVQGTGVQPISNTPQETRTKAIWRLCPYYQPIAIPEEEWLAAKDSGGPDVVAGLLEREGESAMRTLMDTMSDDLFGTGTDDTTGLISLRNGMTGSGDSGYASYGGLSGSDFSNWYGNYNDGDQSNVDNQTSTHFLPYVMGRAVQAVINNGAMERNLVWVVGSTIYAEYNDFITGISQQNAQLIGRYNLNGGAGLPGWTGLQYGAIPVMQDPHANGYDAFLIDMGSYRVRSIRSATFNLQGYQRSENLTQYFDRIPFIGQAVTVNRRRNYYCEWRD